MSDLKEAAQGQFGDENFIVHSNGNFEVRAKWMKGLDDKYIMDLHTGKPYMVPEEFDLAEALRPYSRINLIPLTSFQILGAKMAFLAKNARHGQPLDLQRRWNGKVYDTGDGFVKSFTASANFLYGLAGKTMGLPESVIIAGGGIYNLYNKSTNPNLDTSGDWGNNPDNVRNIFSAFKYGQEASMAERLEILMDLKIDINGDPSASHNIHDRNQLSEAIRNGRVADHPTASFSLGSELLTKTDLASVLSATFATGGVRPGEIQIDPNPDISKALSRLDHFSGGFGLQNALGINALALNSIENVYVDPVLIDLDGKGIALSGINAGVAADFDNSGLVKRTGWFKPGTGMLVQPNANGEVLNSAQWVSEYLGGAMGVEGQPGEKRFNTSFEALKSLDVNTDGQIDNQDETWATLRIWEDADANGKAGVDELKSLEFVGITSIDLTSHVSASAQVEGNLLTGKLSVAKDGATFEAATVDFLGDPIGGVISEVRGGLKVRSTGEEGTVSGFVTTSQTGAVLDASALDVSNLYGSKGDDVLTARPSGSWLVGGAGSNTYNGSAADDVFVISASDNPEAIHGNGGRDTALIVGSQPMELNLGMAGLTIAQGGAGHDILFSGAFHSVFMKAGVNGGTLVGGAGNDVLVGGAGPNKIYGGIEKAVIYAGQSGDEIIGAEKGSIIYAGGGNDTITGRDADDVIEAGKGNATIDGGGGTNLVTLHGDHGEYAITPTETGYRIEDKVAGRDGTLTLTRIQKLNFADISAVTLGGANAMPVTDTVRRDAAGAPLTRNQGARVITAAALLANDQVMGSQGPLRISEVSDGLGGTAALNEQGDVVFTPNPAGQGAMGFKYSLVDAAGNPALGVVSLKTGEVAPMRGEVHLLTDQAPTDPLAARQWYLGDVGVLPVWEQYSGKGVRVGIFEPGGEFATGPETFDIHHPDLAPNVDQGWLASQRKAGTLPPHFSNHATQVAGVLAAARDGQGAVGVAHGASIGGHYLANRGDDLTGLANTSHYDIANNSWGFSTDFALTNLTGGFTTTETALMLNAQYAARNGRGGLGTVMVTAGGNTRAEGGSAQGSLTNSHRHAIQVGAINAQGDLSTLHVGAAPFSNPGTSLLVSAPGSNVLSTSRKLDTERGSVFGSDYSATQGTSFAAPIVSGVTALMLEANPSLGYRDVQRILALSATYVADPTSAWAYNGARGINGGGLHKSDDYGFGKVDARAAVRLAESWSPNSTLANEEKVGVANTTVSLPIAAGQSVRSEHVLTAGVKVEHIEVDIYSEVGQLGDLQLRLTSPSGTQSLLLDRVGKKRSGEGAGVADRGSERAGAFNYTFMSTQHWGEYSQGAWILEAVNAADGKPITLNSWALRAYGEAATADDHYVYTDEFAILALEPGRAVLDDAVNGTAGGNNTFNAAALSSDVNVDLQTGSATLAGRALSIVSPGSMTHVITGDGNDNLIASSQGTVLEGGRGANTLVGGVGRDLYVVRQRAGGQDTIRGFEAGRGELINLSGTGITSFAQLTVAQGGADTTVSLPDGQRITLAETQAATVLPDHFRFDHQATLPDGYFSGAAPAVTTPPAANDRTVVLNGGAQGVGLSFGPDGAEANLRGTVYERSVPGPATFVAARQEGKTDLRNAVRGFNPATDQIDLAQLGISSWSDLVIDKQQRIVINGLALANGTSIKTTPNAEGTFIDVMYIDGLDPNQLAAHHFVFAPAGSTPYVPEPQPAVMQALFSGLGLGLGERAPASAPGPLAHAIAAFAPDAAGGADTLFELHQPANAPLMTQVA